MRETCCSTSSSAEKWKHGSPRRTSVCTSGKNHNRCHGPQGRRFIKCQFSVIAYKSSLNEDKIIAVESNCKLTGKIWGASTGFEPMASALAIICDQRVLLPFFSPCLSAEFRASRKLKKNNNKRTPDRRLLWAAGLDSNGKIFDI